jgi:hypothetical protein
MPLMLSLMRLMAREDQQDASKTDSGAVHAR